MRQRTPTEQAEFEEHLRELWAKRRTLYSSAAIGSLIRRTREDLEREFDCELPRATSWGRIRESSGWLGDCA